MKCRSMDGSILGERKWESEENGGGMGSDKRGCNEGNGMVSS